MNEAKVRELVRKAADGAGGVRALAKLWGISPAMVSDVLNGRRGPGPKVLSHFGLKRVVSVVYVRTH